MLVLSRKPGEKIVVGGGIIITLAEAHGNRVRVGIDAPEQVRILRAELAEWEDEPLGGDEFAETAMPMRSGDS